MQIVIDVPEEDIPKHQDVIDIHLHFIDGHIVDADEYGFAELPKGHGDLIDRNDLLADSYCIDDWSGNEVNIVDLMTVKMADTIIEADKAESEE